MTDVVFLDTETLGLDVMAPIWEFAAIRRRSDGSEIHVEMRIDHHAPPWLSDLPAEFADDYHRRFRKVFAVGRSDAAATIAGFLSGRPHIVGAVPSFDTERIARQLLEPARIERPWHYHLIDVENIVAGHLAGRGELMSPPWKSDELSRAVGVDPDRFARHTAMGDVEWVRAQWDAVMGGAE